MTTKISSTKARSAVIAFGSVAAATAILGCGGGSSSESSMSSTPAVPAASSGKVTIADFDYAPPSITVAAGSAVEFTNTDSTNHTATADDMSFDTGDLGKDKSGSVTLSKPGTYSYFCRFHPFMKGTVVVK